MAIYQSDVLGNGIRGTQGVQGVQGTQGTIGVQGPIGTGVTSVSMTVPAFLSVSGSPVTSNGTLEVTLSGSPLPTANGGLGITSGNSGGIPYFSSTSSIASSSALAANAIVVGGGAGISPSTVTTGANVLLALANNVNANAGITTTTGVATLTNKRVDPRVLSFTTTGSVTPDIANADVYAYSALKSSFTINAPIGSPSDGNKLMFRLKDNGTPQTLTWNVTYTAVGVTIPTTTTASKVTYVGCMYNSPSTRWDVIAVSTEA